MKVMIVGAAGFIGSATAAYLIQNTDFSVVSIDNLSGTPDVFNLEPVMKSRSRHSFYVADVYDQRIMSTIVRLEKPDVILSLVKGQSGCDPALWTLLNMVGDDKHRVRIIHVHTGGTGLLPSEFDVWSERTQNKITLIKRCGVFGPRQYPDRLVPRTIRGLLADKRVDEDLSHHETEWMYVRDFLSALVVILRSGMASVYEVSSGLKASEMGIANKLAALMEKDLGVDVSSHVTISNNMDCTPLIELGWQPRYQLNEALEHTASWYNSNKWAYRGLVC